MIIYDKSGTQISTGVMADLPITEDCRHVEELMKGDYVELSWKDAQKYQIPVGAYIIPFPTETNPYTANDPRYPVKYRLYEEYDPEGKTEQEFEYEPKFEHPIMWLSRLPFILVTGDVSTWAKGLKQTSWGYTGNVGNIATYIVDAINWLATNYPLFGEAIGTGWSAVVDNDLQPSATVNFESVDIWSAAGLIAQAFDCEFHFDFARKQFRLGSIRYGTNITLKSGDNVSVANVSRNKEGFYNAFLVKGSTRNLSQPTDTGENAQVRERLTLNSTTYPDSIMYTNDNGTVISRSQFLSSGQPLLLKELIFDGVYPKLELYLYSVRERECWLLDELGEKVPDQTNPHGYKTYSKWYCRLAFPIYNSDGTVNHWEDYLNPTIIDGQTLQMTFLPNTSSGAQTSLLIGQGDFDLVYFSEQTVEKEDDDISESGFTANAGDYRIVFKEENNLVIPTTSRGGIYPQGYSQPDLRANMATLINIVVDDSYKAIAQSELETVAIHKVQLDRANLNNYVLQSNPIYFHANNVSIHLGQSVTYNDGQDLNGGTSLILNTHVIKIVSQIDFPCVKEITVGNDKVKTTINTIQDKVDTIIANLGNGNYLTENQLDSLIKSYGSRYFLSKTNDDIARGFITFLKGMQVGERFVPGLLGEGGVFRKESDGTTYLECDKMYVRMRAYFDTVEVREYRHSAGNRIASPAGMRCVRVRYIDANGDTVSSASDAVKFRCFFRAKDGENEIRNNFVVGDQAYCHITTVAGASDDIDSKGLNMRHYWRLIIGRSSSPDSEGYHWIDLSNATSETISGVAYSGYQADSDVPQEQDDIVQLGNVNDSTRRGAIVEFVTGGDSPSYQIFQGIGDIGTASTISAKQAAQYTTSGKNYLSLGYATGSSSLHSAGHAYLEVMGDFYFGDSAIANPSTYIRYNSTTKQLDIKANVKMTSPYTSQETDLEAFAAAVKANEDDLQSQIDGEIDTWFYEGTPTLSNAPAVDWNTVALKERHLGDLYYDVGTGQTAGFAYRFIKTTSGGVDTYSWQYIEDTAITEALRIASEAKDTADNKRRVFLTTPTPPYDAGDLWANAVYPSNYTGDTDESQHKYNNDLLRCITAKAEGGTFSINDWQLASKYTDNSALLTFLDGYQGTLTQVQEQIDQKAETWYQDADPSTAWTTDDIKAEHVGDIWCDTSANGGKKTYIYQSRTSGGTTTYYWSEQAVPDSVFDEIDGKTAIYTAWGVWDVPTGSPTKRILQVKDLFIPSSDTTQGGTAYKANKVYRCTAVGTFGSTSPTFQEVSYTDDTTVNAIISKYGEILGITPDATGVGEALGKLRKVLGSSTEISGGLVLTNIIYMKDTATTPSVRAGISGLYQSTETGTGYKGYGTAAWFGGGVYNGVPIDKEVSGTSGSYANYAKSLFRFDGSGYVAHGNLTWDKNGNVTIQGYSINATTLQSGGSNVATEAMLANYVTLNSAQTITGLKTFNNKIKIGDVYLEWESANNALKVYKMSGSSVEAVNLYATGGVSAFGLSTSGGGVTLNQPLASINNLNANPTSANKTLVWTGSEWTYGSVGSGAVSSITIGSTNYSPVGGVVTLPEYVTLSTAQTISGLKTMTHGLIVSGRVYNSGDDEGIVVGMTGNFSALCLGSASGIRSVFYLSKNSSDVYNAFWRFNDGTTSSYNIFHPKKSGTIALTSDIPTAVSQLTNDASYATTSSLENYLPLAGGKMTGASPIAFERDTIALDFRPSSTEITWGSKVELMSSGTEALVFSNKSSSSSYIFRNGYDLINSRDWSEAAIGTPAVHITGQSLYVNTHLGTSPSPSYNFYVTGSSYFSGNIAMTHGSRITKNGGSLYIGDSNSAGWVYLQDIASQDGSEYWRINANGNAFFRNVASEATGTYDLGSSSNYWRYLYVNRIYLASDVYFEKDSTGVHLHGAGFYSDSFVSAFGASSGGGTITLNQPLSSINSLNANPSASGQTLVWNGSAWTYVSVGSGSVSSITVGTTNYSPVGGVVTLPEYVTLSTAQTISGLKTMTHGLVVSGRVAGGGDDEGILVAGATNNLCAVTLGSTNTDRIVFYFNKSTKEAFFNYAKTVDDTLTSRKIELQHKAGTIALTSDIPTNVSQFTNDSGYITSSGSCASATTAGSTRKLAYQSNIGSSTALDDFKENSTLQCATFRGFSTSILNNNGIIISGGWDGAIYGFQLIIDEDPTYIIGLRQRGGSGWNEWKRIPMGDGTGASGTWSISVSGNAGTATTLETSRTIWGQSFDGSGNVTGTIYLPENMPHYFRDPSNTSWRGGIFWGSSGYESMSFVAKDTRTKFQFVNGSDIANWTTSTHTSATSSMTIIGSGVGIGIDSPSYKLHVVGTFYASDNSSIGGTLGVTGATTLSSTLSVGGNTTPSATGTYNLGSSSLYWNYTYTNRLYLASGVYFVKDSNGVRLVGAGFYSDSFVSAFGASSGGSSLSLNGVLSSINSSSLAAPSATGQTVVWDGSAWQYSTTSNVTLKADKIYAANGITISSGSLSLSNGSISLPGYINAYGNIITNSKIAIGYSSVSSSYQFYCKNNGYISGTLTQGSDIRRKNIVGDVDMLDINNVASAPIFRFTWKDRDDSHIYAGTSAQYWQDKLPETILSTDEGYLSMDYGATALIATILTARKVVEHERRIRDLETENERLRKEINELKAA